MENSIKPMYRNFGSRDSLLKKSSYEVFVQDVALHTLNIPNQFSIYKIASIAFHSGYCDLVEKCGMTGEIWNQIPRTTMINYTYLN